MLGSPAVHFRIGHSQVSNDFGEERGSARERLNEHDVHIGTSKGQHQSWQTCARPHISHPSPSWQQRTEQEAVHDVAVPQPRDLARSDEAPRNGITGKSLGITPEQGLALSC